MTYLKECKEILKVLLLVFLAWCCFFGFVGTITLIFRRNTQKPRVLTEIHYKQNGLYDRCNCICSYKYIQDSKEYTFEDTCNKYKIGQTIQ